MLTRKQLQDEWFYPLKIVYSIFYFVRYSLLGFISHMGTSPHSGHYVCHVKDEKMGRWIIFNDNKVAISEKPPKEFGYLYFYKRVK